MGMPVYGEFRGMPGPQNFLGTQAQKFQNELMVPSSDSESIEGNDIVQDITAARRVISSNTGNADSLKPTLLFGSQQQAYISPTAALERNASSPYALVNALAHAYKGPNYGENA